MLCMDYDMAQHPIGYVSRRTGLSTHVIRVWERRYNAITPKRSDTARRLYSEADIDRLKLLRTLSQEGHSIGQVAHRTTAELKRMIRDLSEIVPAPEDYPTIDSVAADDLTAIMRECQSSIEHMDATALRAALMQGRVALPEISVLEQLVGPLMTWVGERWHDGTIRVGHEHLASVIVKNFLARMRESCTTSSDAPVIIVATPTEELHEVGALLAATLASIEGWNEVYFGPNLPAADLANAVMKKGASALALSIAAPGDNPRLGSELRDLRQMLPDEVEIIVGGAGAHRHRDFLEENRIHLVGSLREFRNLLQTIRQAIAEGSSRGDAYLNGEAP